MIQLTALLIQHTVCRQNGQEMMNLYQRGHAGFPVRRVEMRDDIIGHHTNFRAAGDAAPRCVNAVKYIVNCRRAGQERKARAARAAAPSAKRAEALRLVHGAAAARDDPEFRPHRHCQRASVVLEKPLGLPGFQFAQLFGKGRGITRQLESFARQYGRGGMVPVLAWGTIGGKVGDEHVRAERANHSHHVGQYFFFAPELECLPVILGISKIPGPREELLAAVNPPRRQQFLGADHPQFVADFRSEHILPAVAARQREIGGTAIAAARQEGEQARILVVRMRRDQEHASHLPKTPQFLENVRGRVRPGQGEERHKTEGERKQSPGTPLAGWHRRPACGGRRLADRFWKQRIVVLTELL